MHSKLNLDISSLERNQFLWVRIFSYLGFTVTHEMTIAVKSVENIGYLVDRILSKEGITLNDFKWKASQVKLY